VITYSAFGIVLALGVALGMLISGLQSQRPSIGGPSPTPRLSPASPGLSPGAGSPAGSIASASLEIQATFDVRSSDVTAANDALWVIDADGRSAEKIDPGSGEVLKTVALDGRPSDVATAAGSVWVSLEAGPNLIRIDPDSGSVLAKIPAGPGRLATDGASVWLAASSQLMRIDTSTNVIAATFPLSQRDPTYGLAVGFGAVWIGSAQNISRFDIATGTVAATIPGDARRLAATTDAVWALRGTELIRIDPATNDWTPVALGTELADAASSGASLWLIGRPGGAEPALVLELNPASRAVVARAEVGPGAVALDLGLSSVWAVTDDPPALTRVHLP
jgi:hypothetical protein